MILPEDPIQSSRKSVQRPPFLQDPGQTLHPRVCLYTAGIQICTDITHFNMKQYILVLHIITVSTNAALAQQGR